MAIRVEVSEQVVAFVAGRAPEPRRVLRAALRGLTKEAGDLRALEGSLKEYHRLRVRGYRIIFAYRVVGRQRAIQCIFAERRDVVYELFQRLLEEQLLEREQE